MYISTRRIRMDRRNEWAWLGRTAFAVAIVFLPLGIFNLAYLYTAIVLLMVYLLIGIHIYKRYGG
jgi:hypothetical protein